MSSKGTPYTAEEDAIIINAIEESGRNVAHGLSKAKLQLPNRTIGAITTYWYSSLSKKESANAFSLATKHGATKNRKNLKRNEDGTLPDQELKGHLYLLQQILSLSSEQRELIRVVLNS